MLFMEEWQRTQVLQHVGPKKRLRVEDEVRLQERLEIKHSHYRQALQRLVADLSNEATDSLGQSYLRPKRPRPTSR